MSVLRQMLCNRRQDCSTGRLFLQNITHSLINIYKQITEAHHGKVETLILFQANGEYAGFVTAGNTRKHRGRTMHGKGAAALDKEHIHN